MQLRDMHVPKEWADAASRAAAGECPVLVLGATDSGKSTLVRYLLSRLVTGRAAAALLDGDVGMPMSGPPGLIGLTLVRDVDSLGERPASDRAWFVGSTQPASALLPFVLGHAKLAALARAERLPLVIDTATVAAGGLGKEAQLAVIDAVEPKLILGLDREGDMAHLLVPAERRGITVARLAPSPRARPKPRSERSSRSAERFARYFEGSEHRVLQLGDFALEGTLLGSGIALGTSEREEIDRCLDTHVIEAEAAGEAVAAVLASPPHEDGAAVLEKRLGGRRVHVLEAAESEGLLLGLLGGDGECLGLARLIAWSGDGTIEVETPMPGTGIASARRLRLGSVRLAKSGEEIGPGGRERTLASS